MATQVMDSWVSEYIPRLSQEIGLSWLQERTTKYNILELPVGAGKSTLGLTYSNYLSKNSGGDSFILTPQKILQRQYEKEVLIEPNKMFSLYGKGNYQCSKFNGSCEIGSKFKGKNRCTDCIYKSALASAISAPNTVLNYTLALLLFGYTKAFNKRKLVICDEAHNLENELVNFNLVTITLNRAKTVGIEIAKFPKFDDIVDAKNWVETEYYHLLLDYIDKLVSEVYHITNTLSLEKIGRDEKEKIKELETFTNHKDVLDIFLSDEAYYHEFVLITDKNSIKFKPLYGRSNFKAMLDNMGEKFLFMSGTIINHKEFCKNLGIDMKDVSFLSLESEFDKKNRPVAFFPAMKMNTKWLNEENDKNRVKYLNTIHEILDLHKTESGIIHTSSFSVAEWLVQNIDREHHTIYHHNPNSKYKRESVISAFLLDRQPAIIISPSMTEGIDLKYDLGRFNIIAKLPFPYLGDAWIKRRLDLSQEWYSMEVVKSLIQACGRVVRSSDDNGATYIIDESWNYFYYKNKYLFPKWWKDAYMVIK